MKQELAENSLGKFHIVSKVDGEWKCVCDAYQYELETYHKPFKVWTNDKEYLGRDRKSGKFFRIKNIWFPYYTGENDYIWDCVANVTFRDEHGYGHSAGETDIYEKGDVHVDGRWLYDHWGRLTV